MPVLVLSAGAVPQTGTAAPQTPAESRDPVRWSASVADPKRAVRAGERVDVQLTAELDTGWHIYSLSPVPQGPAPTIVGLPAGQPFALAGEISRAAAADQVRSELRPCHVVLRGCGDVRAARASRCRGQAGTASASIIVSYQVCDSRICLPPARVTVSCR